MVITQEQIERFQQIDLPEFLKNSNFTPVRDRIYQGVEALVMQFKNPTGPDLALKWYASLEGKSYRQLVQYAAEIQEDEEQMYAVGLTTAQIPPTNIYIKPGETPQIYSSKDWIKGRLLSEISLEEIVQNRLLRDSLISLFRLTDEFYQRTGHFPDIKLGEALYFFNLDAKKNPFFKESSNIIIRNNMAILHDTKAMRYPRESIESIGLGIKQKLVVQTAEMLALL